MRSYQYYTLLFVSLFSMVLSGCSAHASNVPWAPGTAMLSLSSDGHYAISSQFDGRIILWDLVDHTHKLIAKKANIYSVYYIKHSPYFMWQSLSSKKPHYYAMERAPKPQELKQVAQGSAMYLTHEGGHRTKNDGHYYLYFKSHQGKSGYKRQVIEPGLQNDSLIRLLKSESFLGASFGEVSKVDSFSCQQKILYIAISHGYQSGTTVHVQDPAGHEVMHFNNFPVYGQVMAPNLTTYFASDFNWDIFSGLGGKHQQLMQEQGGFYRGKLLNLTLSSDNRYLLSSGSGSGWDKKKLVVGVNYLTGNYHRISGLSLIDGVVLWTTQTGHPMLKYPGNHELTYATISPDGNYIVAGDSNDVAFEWNAITAKRRFKLWSIFYGKAIGWNKKTEEAIKWTTRGLIPVPKDYTSFIYEADDVRDNKSDADEKVVALKFIDPTHYLRFNYYVSYAILYSVDDPRPLKYFPLGMKPIPAVNNYTQDEALDTSPSAHVLVIAQAGNHTGIIEYKYDPVKKTLNKVWVGNAPPTPPG